MMHCCHSPSSARQQTREQIELGVGVMYSLDEALAAGDKQGTTQQAKLHKRGMRTSIENEAVDSHFLLLCDTNLVNETFHVSKST